MKIRYGYELSFHCPAPTPMILMLHTHPSRAGDLLQPDQMRTTPQLPLRFYQDLFGNVCTRLVAPPGEFRVTADAIIADSGIPEAADFTRWSTRSRACRTSA